jgi:hypothetical protein
MKLSDIFFEQQPIAKFTLIEADGVGKSRQRENVPHGSG